MNYLKVIFVFAMSMYIGYAAKLQKNSENELDNNLDAKASIEPNPLRNFLRYHKMMPETVPYEIGQTLKLTCEAMASPAPSIRWLKNNQPIKEYNIESNDILESSQTSLARVSSTLLISKPSSNLEDKYTCILTSGTNTEHISTTVYTIESNLPFDRHHLHLPTVPIITYTHKVFMDNIGSNVVIPCRGQGHPHPHISWVDSDGKLILKRNRRMRVLRTGELIITNLRWADMGNYECIAKNDYGQNSTITFLYPLKPE